MASEAELNAAMSPALPKLNIDSLETAIDQAKAAGVTPRLIARAESKLDQAIKRQSEPTQAISVRAIIGSVGGVFAYVVATFDRLYIVSTRTRPGMTMISHEVKSLDNTVVIAGPRDHCF
mmetsp:Transcript_1394/g.3012  ORF Transcript_1394/g.3012 Transcript_1394/m.3012 type:complete len:120 (-) Transcript_1394:17-376(-)